METYRDPYMHNFTEA